MQPDPDVRYLQQRRIVERQEADPPHPASLTVKLDCGHGYSVHGLFAQRYRDRDEVPCEVCVGTLARYPREPDRFRPDDALLPLMGEAERDRLKVGDRVPMPARKLDIRPAFTGAGKPSFRPARKDKR